jgi:hypothetical protein
MAILNWLQVKARTARGQNITTDSYQSAEIETAENTEYREPLEKSTTEKSAVESKAQEPKYILKKSSKRLLDLIRKIFSADCAFCRLRIRPNGIRPKEIRLEGIPPNRIRPNKIQPNRSLPKKNRFLAVIISLTTTENYSYEISANLQCTLRRHLH